MIIQFLNKKTNRRARFLTMDSKPIHRFINKLGNLDMIVLNSEAKMYYNESYMITIHYQTS